MDNNRVGIYIHIPFCVKKCAYCDFLSFGICDAYGFGIDDIHSAYIDAVISELDSYIDSCKGRTISTIYIGGGTPSILDYHLILKLIDYIKRNFKVDDNAEITIECNPKTTDGDKLKAYKDSGINRLSLGLQSTDDTMLKILGRVHTYGEFLTQYDEARCVGFNNINVDLISALPNQSVNMYIKDLKNVIMLNPEHISSYSLIIEEGTEFYNDDSILDALPNEEEAVKMYELTNEYLKNAGFNRYEISNYAKEGYESKHNSSYWMLTDYIGVGLGASCCFDGRRYKNHNSIKEYINRDFHKDEDCLLKPEDTMEEYMFLGLRMMKGVSVNGFYDKTGEDIHKVYGDVIDKHIKLGNLISYSVSDDEYIRLSENAIMISNRVFADFML